MASLLPRCSDVFLLCVSLSVSSCLVLSVFLPCVCLSCLFLVLSLFVYFCLVSICVFRPGLMMCACGDLDGCFAISSCFALMRFGFIAALRIGTAASGARCAPRVVVVLLVCIRFGGLLSCSTWIMKRSRTRPLGRFSSSWWRSDLRLTWSLNSRPSSRGRSRISRYFVSCGVSSHRVVPSGRGASLLRGLQDCPRCRSFGAQSVDLWDSFCVLILR